MGREELDQWCQRGIFGVVLAMLIYAPLALGAVPLRQFVGVEIAAVIVGLLFLVRIWSSEQQLFWPPICWGVVVFVAYAAIRYWTSPLEYVGRHELTKICVYALLFIALINSLQKQEQLQIIVVFLVFLAAAISVYAVFQFMSGHPLVWNVKRPEMYLDRGSGTYFNPNHLAGFLEIILPLGLATILFSRVGHVMKILIGYACLVMLFGVGATLSRGGWISMGVTIFCFFGALLFQRRFRLGGLLLLGLIVSTGLIFSANTLKLQKRFERAVSGGKVEDYRVDLWKPTVEMWKDHFWLGVGPAEFDYRFHQYRPPQIQSRPEFAHNDYLNTLADYGTVGLAIVVATLAILGFQLFKTWPKMLRRSGEFGDSKSNRAGLVFGSVFSLLAILVHSIADFNLHIPANAILVIFAMAVITAHFRYATDGFRASSKLGRVLVSALIGGLVLFVAAQSITNAREARWLHVAKSSLTGQEKIAALKHAHEIEPANPETAYEIGELLRETGFEGEGNYQTVTEEALSWFRKGAQLNPFNPYNFIGIGMCLDWLGRKDQASASFEHALNLDPNNYYVMNYEGWHRVQIDDLPEAKRFFERANGLKWNPTAVSYLEIINDRMKEKAAKTP